MRTRRTLMSTPPSRMPSAGRSNGASRVSSPGSKGSVAGRSPAPPTSSGALAVLTRWVPRSSQIGGVPLKSFAPHGGGGRWLQWEIVTCSKPHCSKA